MVRNTVIVLFLGLFLLTQPLPVQAAIVPQFDDAATFSEGLAAVKVTGKWGFIDTGGNWVIKPQYTAECGLDELKKVGELVFTENYLPLKKGDKWGFINRNGEMAVAPKYDEVRPFSEGLAAVAINNKWGYVDATGQMVIPPQFDACGPFKEGLALITIEKGTATGWSPLTGLQKKAVRDYFYIDKAGKVVIQGPFDDVFPNGWQHAIFSGDIPRRAAAITAATISSFSDGLAATRTKAGVLGYIDKQGKALLEFGKDISGLYPFRNGIAYLKTADGRMLAINKAGARLTEPQFIFIGEYSGEDRIAATDKEKEYGYVNQSFRFILIPKYEEAGAFYEKIAPVKENKRWRYIDRGGRYVNALQFEAATDFRAGVAFVKTQGKFALVNTQFESIQVETP